MALFSKLFGKTKAAEKKTPETENHKGFTIEPTPMKEGSTYRISALITKVVDGETKSHQLIRADTTGDLAEAKLTSVLKAKMMIDQMGDRIF